MRLEVSILELIFRGIPESFLVILGIYEITKTKLDKKRWVCSSFRCRGYSSESDN